ncbi:hypothetical protein MRB53_039367 [Persea americana]|nr:hypothetical protein MRB53_039367 [Persea americana]
MTAWLTLDCNHIYIFIDYHNIDSRHGTIQGALISGYLIHELIESNEIKQRRVLVTSQDKLTIRLCEGRFVSHHDVTIGVEFGSRIVPVGPPASLAYNINNPVAAQPVQTKSKSKGPPKEPRQKHLKLSLWDTAGQETYKAVTRSYFRGASGALLVFDITRRPTFNSVTTWLTDLRLLAEEHIVVILVGNKSDLATASTISGDTSQANQRQVTREEAEEWCKNNGVMEYVETSAKSGENVERAFLEVAERIYQNIEAGKYDLNDKRSGVKGPGAGGGTRTVNLNRSDGTAKKSGCC